MVRVVGLVLASGLAGCSALPESWNFSLGPNIEEPVQLEQMEASSELATSTKVPVIDLGASKTEVLDILGPDIQVNIGGTSAEHYIKSGEVYDVLYFRQNADSNKSIRAYLFKDEILIGIGLSHLD